MVKQRNSSFELLRIISMVLVLVVHFDFLAIGNPTREELVTSFISCMTRISFESLAICCVNVFVLISGWFGIRSSLKGFSNFIYQCLFIAMIVILCNITIGLGDSVKPSYRNLINFNWFVVSYIGLYFLSPVLNAFINTSGKKLICTTLLLLFSFEFLFGFTTKLSSDFNYGYSILHFVLLYLLARYCNVYRPWYVNLSKSIYFVTYVFSALIMTIIGYLVVLYNISTISDVFNYYNPIVIIESLSLLLFFSKFRLNSTIVNNVAMSCFSVFLLHTHPYVSKAYLYPFVKELYLSTPGSYMLLICVLLVVLIFLVSISIDRLRLFTWNMFYKIFDR